jgi:gliding motility-associated protein GldC
MKQTEIKLEISLDENHIPEKIQWFASDAPNNQKQEVKAMLLSLWDANLKNTLKIDLWTKDMTMHDMKVFFHQTLLTMTDTLLKSTGEEKIVKDMRDFCDYFAEKMGISYISQKNIPEN